MPNYNYRVRFTDGSSRQVKVTANNHREAERTIIDHFEKVAHVIGARITVLLTIIKKEDQ